MGDVSQSFDEWLSVRGRKDWPIDTLVKARAAFRAAWNSRTTHYEAMLAEKDAEIAEEQKLILHYRDEGQRYRDRIEKLEEMISNGLGWEDMQDDH